MCITCWLWWCGVPLTFIGNFLMAYLRAILHKDGVSLLHCLRTRLILNYSVEWFWTCIWASAPFIIAATNLISLLGIPASYIFQSFLWPVLSFLSLLEIHMCLIYSNIVLPVFLKHLFNFKQLIYGRASCSAASLRFHPYNFCVLLWGIYCLWYLYGLYIIKPLLGSFQDPVITVQPLSLLTR